MYKAIIIDNNKLLADNLATQSLWAKYNIIIDAICYDGETGLEIINNGPPDIIVSDIRLPGIDGLKMIQSIKESAPDTMIIFISAYDDFKYAQQALRLGAQDYLLKPFSSDALEQAISNAVKVLENKQKDNPKNEELNPMVAPILQWMGERLDKKITAEEVAKHFFMSTSRLDKLLRKYCKKSFREIHMQMRLDKARTMLNDVRYNIDDIARQTGFQSYNSFYRAFTRELGISPTDCRDQMQKGTEKDT